MSRLCLRPTQPPVQWVLGSILWVKQPEFAVNHSPPSSAEVTNEWSASAPPVCLHIVDRENFTFAGLGNGIQPYLFIHHLCHWTVAVILLKNVYELQAKCCVFSCHLLLHKLHVLVMTGIITENPCRRRLMWKSEGLDDDSCNRTVSVLLINRFLVILMIKVYWRCICSVPCWFFGVMWPPKYTVQD
jgi:hypothetical protein